jgi:transposase-like protein
MIVSKHSPGGAHGGRSLLAKFAEEIGEELALQISACFGGRQLYIPHKPSPGSDLVQAIGEPAALKLAKRFGGVFYAIPNAPGKRARILALLEEGKTVSRVAETVGCTERYVYKVQAESQAREGKGSRPRGKGRRRKQRQKSKPPGPAEVKRRQRAEARRLQRDLFDPTQEG